MVRDDRDAEQSQIPPKNRDEAKERDQHRCRFCGARGPGADGVANLQVHHIEDDPTHCGIHDLANLVTMCDNCHEWQHKSRVTADDIPVEVSKADQEYLNPNDYAILQVLGNQGPSRPSEIADAVPPDITSVAIRERLWLLAGLDNAVESRDERLVAQSARSGKWGLVEQISQSERGRIPSDTRTLIQRIRDERARRALARGCTRATVAQIFDMHERSTWYMQRRAMAYEFPLDALARGADEPQVVTQSGDAGRSGDDGSARRTDIRQSAVTDGAGMSSGSVPGETQQDRIDAAIARLEEVLKTLQAVDDAT